MGLVVTTVAILSSELEVPSSGKYQNLETTWLLYWFLSTGSCHI